MWGVEGGRGEGGGGGGVEFTFPLFPGSHLTHSFVNVTYMGNSYVIPSIEASCKFSRRGIAYQQV